MISLACGRLGVVINGIRKYWSNDKQVETYLDDMFMLQRTLCEKYNKSLYNDFADLQNPAKSSLTSRGERHMLHEEERIVCARKGVTGT